MAGRIAINSSWLFHSGSNVFMSLSCSSPATAPLTQSQHWIGAFFDMDNTLVPGPSIEIGFFRYLWQDGVVGWPELWNSFRHALRHMPPFSLSPLRRNKLYLLGQDVSQIEQLAMEYVELFVLPRVASRGLGRLAHHTNAGHVVAVVSGSPDCLVKPLAAKLGVPLVFGAKLESQAGLYTGRVFAPLPYGEGKGRYIQRLAAQYNLDLSRSYAYGDSPGDFQVLQLVGHPLVVNPIRGMARIARHQGWPVTQWA
jgi:HAD superfamily hydrolase (TIGR01490 family)